MTKNGNEEMDAYVHPNYLKINECKLNLKSKILMCKLNISCNQL